MADTRTRIINLPEATTLDPSMNFVEDSADGSGTRRVTYDTLKGAINQEGAVNLAPAYSNAATYNVGDLCTYQGTLYTCNTQISTAEDWTAAHWTLTNMASDLYQLKSDLTAVTENQHSENYFDKENATSGTYQGTPILTSPMVNVTEGDAFYYFWAQSNVANISSGTLFLVYQYDVNGNKTSSEMWKHVYTVPAGIIAVQFVTVQTTASYIMMRKGVDAAYYDDYYDYSEAKDSTARDCTEAIAQANGDIVSTNWDNIIYYSNTSKWVYTPTRIESQVAIAINRDTQITCDDSCVFNVQWWTGATLLDGTTFAKETGWINGGNYVNVEAGSVVTFVLKYADDSAISSDACSLMRYKMYGQDVLNNSYNSAFHVHNYWGNPARRFASLFGDSNEVESFLFFTDQHLCEGTGWEFEFKELMGQIQQCYNNTPTTFCLNGGDWLGNSDTVADAKYKLGLINGQMKSMFNRHYDLVGNHDTNAQGVERLSNNCLRNLWFRDFEHCYYTFVGQSTKFYCFNTGNELDALSADNGYGLNQCKWFAANLLSETMDHIALAMHIIYVNSSHTVDPIPQKIMDIAQAYNNRSTITVDDTSYDFASSTGKIEFAIAGHLHADYNSTINGIPVIVSANVRKDTSVGATFDLVYIDYDNATVNLVRVGSGTDRTIALT